MRVPSGIRLVLIGLLVLAVSLPFMTIPPIVTAQQPRRGGVLRVANIGEPPTLDQHWTTTQVTIDIMYGVTETLFALTRKFEARPMLVDKWTLSADRLTYTLTLRKGVRFHNNKELTSEDVKASLERWGRVSGRGRVLFGNVTSLTTPDASTIVLKLREPYGLLPVDLAIPAQGAAIYPKEMIDEAGAGQLRRFIGTGPYRLVEYLPDRHVRLDRFDGYAARAEEPDGATGKKNAYLDSIYFVPVPEAATRIAGVKRGEFQWAHTIPSDEYDRLRADPDLVPYVWEVPAWLPAILNHRQGMMTNHKIRQAFQAAVDGEGVLRAAFGNPRFWRVDSGLIPKEHYMWTDAGKENYNQKNPEKARRLLQEAGYKGEPVRWITSMDFPEFGNAAQATKPMLERAGFTVDLQMMDWATVVSRRARPELWDVFSTGFGFVPDPVFLIQLIPSWPGWYENRDIQAMMTLLRRHQDPKVRKGIWSRMQRLWYQDVGTIKYGDYFVLHLHRKDLKNYTSLPTHTWWNAWLER